MKPSKPRIAHKDEADTFVADLKELLEKTQERIQRLRSGGYELRVMTVRTHDVSAHVRKTFQKVYLAKKFTKKSKTSTVAKP